MEQINIATSLNSLYLRYTYVMLKSLYMNNENLDIHVYILQNDLTDSDKNHLNELTKQYNYSINYIFIDKSLFPTSLPTTTSWSLETYYRLTLLDLLPDNIDRLLYLDVDMIINKSIRELYFTPFDGKLFCACEDMTVANGFDDTDKRRELFKNILSDNSKYFNAGMMLWNIKELRKHYSFKSYIDLAQKLNFKLTAPDQDLLNYMHAGQIKYLDEYQYDLFTKLIYNHGFHYDDIRASVTIAHFAGTKPWEGQYVHYDIEQLWWDYAKLTPFYFELLEEYLASSINNPLIYNTMTTMSEQKKQLQDNLNDSIALNQKLLRMLNPS